MQVVHFDEKFHFEEKVIWSQIQVDASRLTDTQGIMKAFCNYTVSIYLGYPSFVLPRLYREDYNLVIILDC